MACNCYKIIQDSSGECFVDYYDCNGDSQSILLSANTTTYLCAKTIVGSNCSSATYNSPCFNGECLTGGTEILLYKLISQSGPCPDICDGTTQLGGPEGTSVIDIITGKPI